ncbi:MAG: prepilin peptidase, partial [Candidatus Saccharimonadales bacterium]
MTLVALVLFGLSLGSFINALVWRLWQQENKKQKTKNDRRYSILKGRSICPHCKHILQAKDLIPVLSWVLLRGKCRYCNKPISAQYPLVEAGTAALFILSYVFWPAFQDLHFETVDIIGF